MPETSNTQDVSVREENGAEGGVAGPQSRLSFKGTQGSERQLEILRAAHSHPNIFVYGKKQEAWLEICHVLNPNPLFAGKLTPTTAKDKFEELKSNWLAKNRKLLAAGGLNELKSEYDKLFREVILLENEHEEARRTKKTCTQRSKDIRLSDSEWCKDFFVESNPPPMFPPDHVNMLGNNSANNHAMIAANGTSSNNNLNTGIFSRAMLLVDSLHQQGIFTVAQARKLRWLCMWQKPPIAVLMTAYGSTPDVFSARCKELLDGMEANGQLSSLLQAH